MTGALAFDHLAFRERPGRLSWRPVEEQLRPGLHSHGDHLAVREAEEDVDLIVGGDDVAERVGHDRGAYLASDASDPSASGGSPDDESRKIPGRGTLADILPVAEAPAGGV